VLFLYNIDFEIEMNSLFRVIHKEIINQSNKQGNKMQFIEINQKI